MGKKNIVIIISSLKLWWWAEKTACMLSKTLNVNKYKINYLTLYKSDFNYSYKWNNYCLCEKHTKNILYKLFKLLYRAYKIKTYCKKNKIDTSISFMEESNFSNILSKKIFLNKSKIIVSSRNNSLMKNKIYKILIKLLYNFADIITTLSKEERYNLIKYFNINKDKIFVTYNWINIDDTLKQSEYLIEENELFDNWKFTYINIWRLTKQKNQKMLLNSFNELNKKYTNTQLIILWEGDLKEILIKKCESLESKNNIYFLWIKKNVFNYLKKSDCFVFTSSREWFWHVLIEAMACDLPIISTQCTAWPIEILDSNSNLNFNTKFIDGVKYWEFWLLTPVANWKELTRAMEIMYIDTPLREKYKNKSKKRITYFWINTVIKSWEKLF